MTNQIPPAVEREIEKRAKEFALAREYGVSQGHLSRIKTGKNWRDNVKS